MPVKVIVNMREVDDAEAFAKVLREFAKKAGTGGDCEMYIGKGDVPEKVGGIGHDVWIGDVEVRPGE
jgi:hypothetical protein